MENILKYTGKGFLPDVPAKDLTEEETKKYNEELLINSGCYLKISDNKEYQKKEGK